MRGFTGSAALAALGALSAAAYGSATFVSAWLGIEPMGYHLGVFGVAFALYLGSLWLVMARARSMPGALAMILGFAFLFRVIMLPTPVYLSSDLYRYLWDGRVQLAGVNPYRYPPAAPELGMLRDDEIYPRINRPAAITVYPPGSQWLFGLAALLPGSIHAWRLLLLAIESATALLLLRLLARIGARGTAIIAYAWSPLGVYEGVQAGHVDLAVIPVILLALLLRIDGSSLRAGVALGLAVLMKLYPAVLLAPWWRRHDWRFPAAVGATVALGYAPYVVGVGAGALGFLPTYLSSPAEDFNIGLRALLTWGIGWSGEGPRAIAMGLLSAVLAGVLAWIALRRAATAALALWRATALAIGAYLLLIPTAMHPWYVLWIIPFLCVHPSAAWLFFSGAVTLSYAEYLVHPAPLPWWAWLGQYGPLYALLIHAGYRSVRQGAGAAVAIRTA